MTGVPVTIKGQSAQNFLTFTISGSLSGGQDRTLSATSAGQIPDLIDDQYKNQKIDWSADVTARTSRSPRAWITRFSSPTTSPLAAA